MRILCLALADDSRRLMRGFPPKGARLLLNPDLEIAGLFTVTTRDQLYYQDEKAEVLDFTVPFDWALISTDFWQESRVREVILEIQSRRKPVVLFGPLATTKASEFEGLAEAVVVGNILNVWAELCADAREGRLKSRYQASVLPVYAAPDYEQTRKAAFSPSFQCLRAVVGCCCPLGLRDFCRQYLYHHENVGFRDLDELTGEVYDLRHKHVYLLDEDVARYPDFYREFFHRVWRHRREWTVQSGVGLLDDVKYIRLLAKAGVRVVNLGETWLDQTRIARALSSRTETRMLRNQVRLLHRQRLLVGLRVSLFLGPDEEYDFAGTYHFIDTLGVDFLSVRTFERAAEGVRPKFVHYQPGLLPDRPTWWKNQFYGLDAIIRRSLRRPVRVGFYATFRYYFPRSFALRQNFLEGIAYPP